MSTSTAKAADPLTIDVERVRGDFPILSREVHGKPLVYLDNAATAQKPQSVIDVIERYYREENANIHRGVHYLSETATEAYEQARYRIQELIGAPTPEEVLFVRGTTEGINLVASSFGERFVSAGDEIISWLHCLALTRPSPVCVMRPAQELGSPFKIRFSL